jgi:hypothetical protein
MKTLQYEDICAPKNESEYRVYFTSPLRDYLKIVERLMCAKSWDEIEFGRVPSIAMNRLKKVFERHEPERWKEYLEKLKEGKEKVQGKQLYPHEIVSQMMDKNNSDNSIILEKQWEQQLEKLTPETISQLQKTLVISDVSGSMNGTPMMVSIALGLLISSLLPEPWKDLLITFSNNPTFHKVCGETLQERIYNIAGMEWGGSTDLTKTFTMILEKCMQQEIPPSEMPDKILIMSDMQFNESDRRWETNHQMIERKYLTNGYKMPQIIYWNLRGDTIDFPVNAKQFNVICISGYSPSILNAILNGKEPNPGEIVKNILDHERYERVSLSI